jgi:hypothetical protein
MSPEHAFTLITKRARFLFYFFVFEIVTIAHHAYENNNIDTCTRF